MGDVVNAFDLEVPTMDPETATDTIDGANQMFADLARDHWIVRSLFGFAVLHSDDAVAVLRDKRWHSASGRIAEMYGIDDAEFDQRRRVSILSAEGDVHQRLRRLVGQAFSPLATDRLRPFMREVVNGLVDPVAGTGSCDVAVDICEPSPIPIICELLGALLARRMPDLRLDGTVTWKPATVGIFGPEHLPVRFTPTP